MQIPAGYTLLEPQVAASVATTLAGGFSTSLTLRVAKQVEATITYKQPDGTVVATNTVSGIAGSTQRVTPTAPVGYTLADQTARIITLTDDDSDNLTLTVTPVQTTPPTPAPATITVRYVNDDTPLERQVATDKLTGVVGETGTYAAMTPTGFQLATDQKPRLRYRFTGATQQVLVIHLTAVPTQLPDTEGPTTVQQTPVDTPQPATNQKPAVALATVNVVDGAGQVLRTQAFWGQPGQRIVFDTPSLVAPLARRGLQVVTDQTSKTAVFTGAAQRFTVQMAPRTTADPLARRETVPFATDAKAQAAAKQPSGHTLIAQSAHPDLIATALQVTAPIVPAMHRDPAAKVIMSHSRLFSEAIRGRGNGDGELSGLAAYFVALSGKINYGIKAEN
jgi:hypothetical protein